MTNRQHQTVAACALLAAIMGICPAQQEYEFEAGNWKQAPVPAKGSPEGELSLIRSYMDRGYYAQVEKAARAFLRQYPEDAASEEVMLLTGEAQMKLGRYFQGFEWFEKQLSKFPGGRFSNRALDREFAIAEAFLAGKKRLTLGIFYIAAQDDGLDILQRIAEHAPGTEIAEKALLRIGDYHYKKGDYPRAAEAYDHYLELFAKSPQAAEAMLRAANATFWSFGGISYDDTPLIEAAVRYREFAERYPISAEAANVPGILNQIHNLRAEKVYQEAEFYKRIGKPQAAAFTYRYVLDKYPQTDCANRAELALRGLERGLPSQPLMVAGRTTTQPTEVHARLTRPRELEGGEVIELEKLAPKADEIRELK